MAGSYHIEQSKIIEHFYHCRKICCIVLIKTWYLKNGLCFIVSSLLASYKNLFNRAISGLPWCCGDKKSTCQFKRHGFNPWVGKMPWSRKWHDTIYCLLKYSLKLFFEHLLFLRHCVTMSWVHAWEQNKMIQGPLEIGWKFKINIQSERERKLLQVLRMTTSKVRSAGKDSK